MESMLKLIQINFYCQTVFHKKGIPIKALNVMTIRKLAFEGFHVIARKIKGKTQKELVFDFAIKELGKEMFPTKIMSKGKRKGEEVFLDEARDMSDSYALMKAALKIYCA